ncbi:MAG: hypothetical protein V1672_00365 [Candidatus Diapherotrites archaeon]
MFKRFTFRNPFKRKSSPEPKRQRPLRLTESQKIHAEVRDTIRKDFGTIPTKTGNKVSVDDLIYFCKEADPMIQKNGEHFVEQIDKLLLQLEEKKKEFDQTSHIRPMSPLPGVPLSTSGVIVNVHADHRAIAARQVIDELIVEWTGVHNKIQKTLEQNPKN